ncbi:MAG: SPASM domain-containing protein, partial [Lachnospiraceae bacterium]|nr:SPASM domain-containing protein [Lachnospiraceae bacterium]MDY2758608.1 SPASM domain-containing protein [Lachnospiraceae bacterium]
IAIPLLNEYSGIYSGKKYRMMPTIATSGIKLADKSTAEQLIYHGITYIDISMKGSNSKEWIKTTGVDGYNDQMKAIQNLASLHVEFTCSMVVTMDNVQSVCDTVQNALNNGGRQFSFTFEIDNDGAQFQSKEDYTKKHRPQDLISAFLAQIDKLESLTDDWWIEYSFPLCVYTEKQLDMLQNRLAAPCQVHTQDAVTFSPSMDILSCDMYMNESLGELGRDFNTYEEFLDWRTHAPYYDAVSKLREMPSDKCLECSDLQNCFGGCPVLWKHYSLEDIRVRQ